MNEERLSFNIKSSTTCCRWIISRSTINNYLRINGTLVSHLKYGIAMCRNLFHLRVEWGKKNVCALPFCQRHNPSRSLNSLWIMLSFPRFEKKTAAAAAAQQFNTSCTFSPRRFWCWKIKKGSLFPSYCRQLKAGSCLFTYDPVYCCSLTFCTPHTYTWKFDLDGRHHRSYGDSSHISSRSN